MYIPEHKAQSINEATVAVIDPWNFIFCRNINSLGQFGTYMSADIGSTNSIRSLLLIR